MSNSSNDSSTARPGAVRGPFRRALLRGLGIILPPLLTIVLFIWVWNAVESYILRPIESAARYGIVWTISDIRKEVPAGAQLIENQKLSESFDFEGVRYVRAPSGQRYFPESIKRYVDGRIDALASNENPPLTASAYYHRYAKLAFLPRWLVLILFLTVFVLVLYIIGRAFAVGVGRVVVLAFERLVNRVPILRNVYSSVKQITDFLFGEREIEFTRVVAIEYPRRGIWTLGFVTGESMQEISLAANEAVLSVLIPTSPMPMTGFTMTVRRSEALDMNLTIDQALQYIVSCGVVVPPQQQQQFDRIKQQWVAPHDSTQIHDNQPSQGGSSKSSGTGEPDGSGSSVSIENVRSEGSNSAANSQDDISDES